MIFFAGNDYTVEELGDIKAQDAAESSNSEDRELTFSDYIKQI